MPSIKTFSINTLPLPSIQTQSCSGAIKPLANLDNNSGVKTIKDCGVLSYKTKLPELARTFLGSKRDVT